MKIKKVLLALLLCAGLTLTGCTAKRKDDLVCTSFDTFYGVDQEVTTTYENNGKRITKQTTITVISSEDDEIIEALAEEFAAYDFSKDFDYEGVTYDMKKVDNTFVETITIDFKTVSNSTLVELGVLDSSDKDADYIDVSLTRKNLESEGFVCKTVPIN